MGTRNSPMEAVSHIVHNLASTAGAVLLGSALVLLATTPNQPTVVPQSVPVAVPTDNALLQTYALATVDIV